jgi:fructose-1,6-bisphosphatase/inositol monophosphatase family enzyme
VRPPPAAVQALSAEAAFLPVIRGLALHAGRRIHELMKTELVRTRKADRSLVTNADHESNDILRQGLRRAFPAHAVVSEETGREGPASADYVWMIDPLDGTKAYAQGIPGFSVMAGLLKDEKPVLGVVYDPLGGHLYEAAKGAGCFYTAGRAARTAASVSRRDRWSETPMITSTGFPE